MHTTLGTQELLFPTYALCLIYLFLVLIAFLDFNVEIFSCLSCSPKTKTVVSAIVAG